MTAKFGASVVGGGLNRWVGGGGGVQATASDIHTDACMQAWYCLSTAAPPEYSFCEHR